MRLANGANKDLTCTVPGRAPQTFGATEMRFPAPTVTLRSHAVTELEANAAAVVLIKLGPQGVVKVQGDTADEDAIIEAKARRAEYLERYINAFREENARRRASQQEVLIPRGRHRLALNELRELRKNLAEIDQELYAEPTPSDTQVEDVALDGLEAFGLTPETAPLVPGLTDAEALGSV